MAGEGMPMTFAEAILKNTGCSRLSDLRNLPPDRRRQLAMALSNFPAEKIPLQDWNELLAALGGKTAAVQAEAKERLLMLLRMEGDLKNANAPPKPVRKSSPSMENKSTMQTVLRVWNACTTVIVAMVAVLAVALVGVRLFGLQVFTVLSGSMEPVYHVGSLIYVKSIDPMELHAGEDITFMLDEDTVVTHRIVGIVPDENDPSVIRFRTQGVANDQEDGSLVHYRNVIGKPVFTIPYLGYLANYIQNPPGTYVSISVGAILLLLIFLPDLLTGEDEEEKEEKAPRKTKSIKNK
ncbi:MAG: signal peptidase I [Ruminococcaceae bacterium]|nr:signal peptidase I [Oscillospiraceae bacterium]